MFEPKIFRKQMFRIEESTCDIVGTIRHPGHCAPLYPSLRPWLSAVFCSGLLTWSAYVPYNDTLYTKE